MERSKYIEDIIIRAIDGELDTFDVVEDIEIWNYTEQEGYEVDAQVKMDTDTSVALAISVKDTRRNKMIWGNHFNIEWAPNRETVVRLANIILSCMVNSARHAENHVLEDLRRFENSYENFLSRGFFDQNNSLDR
jgi:hypothetical protein